MNLEANKLLVKQFFRYLEEGRLVEVEELIAPDFQWWGLGQGDIDVSFIKDFWIEAYGSKPGPNSMMVVEMTAEDNRVAAEVTSNLKLPDGRRYKNAYHIVFLIHDGRIAKVREYFDTAYTRKMFGDPDRHQARLAEDRHSKNF